MAYDVITEGITILAKVIRNVDVVGPRALSEYVRPATIMGSVVVDVTLSDDDIIMNLASMLNSFYIGYVTTALQLNTKIEDGRTVRDILTIVSTNNHMDLLETVDKRFLNSKIDTDSVVSMRSNGSSSYKSGVQNEPSLFSGKVIEIKLNVKDLKQPVSITIMVQLIARNVKQAVIEQGFAASNKQSVDQRWAMYQAGEISFWSGFIFELDLIKKHKNALKNDDTGYLYEELSSRSNKLAKNIETGMGAGSISQNSANNIMIIESRFFKGMMKRLGIKETDFTARQKLMRNNYSLMICVIDPMYSTVQIYFNGIRQVAEYSYKAIIANYGKSQSEKSQLQDIMSQFAAGNSPKVY